MGLTWLMPIMGVIAAIILSVLFWVVEIHALLQAMILIVVIVGVAKLAIKLGVELSLYSKS